MKDTSPTNICQYGHTPSLHDALPCCPGAAPAGGSDSEPSPRGPVAPPSAAASLSGPRPPTWGSMTQLQPELLLQAYAVGVFPMAEGRDDPRLFFVDPDHRGNIPLGGFHVPRSPRRTVPLRRFEVT